MMSGKPLRDVIPTVCVMLFVAAVAFLCARCLTGCKPVENPRAEAHGVVLAVADAVHLADQACASIALAKGDAPLARSCDVARDEARLALIAAEDALYALTAAEQGGFACAFDHGVSAAQRLASLIAGAGGKLPPQLDDALHLARTLVGGCRG